MNAELTETRAAQGTIFYDALCPFCRSARRVLNSIFTRRGFRWLPLQVPGLAARLGLSESELLQEMKLQLPAGQVLGGVDCWIFLCRSVWWLWPIGVLLGLPGVYRLSGACYRWVARHRYCFGGRCRLRGGRRGGRSIPFLDLP